MEIIVKVYRDSSQDLKGKIERAVRSLNGIQNYFLYRLECDADIDICEGKQINWEQFCEGYHLLGEQAHVIYITEKPFDDNWFSHEELWYAVITTDQWESIFSPPSLRTYLMYQIAQASVNFEGELNENMEMRMVHVPSEGCMFDFCGKKEDIKLGMLAGNICPNCRASLLQYGIREEALEAIEKMLIYVRSETMGRPINSDGRAAFVVMRFFANDENDHAYKYGIKSALEFLGIECVRADNILTSNQLLEIIRNGIERSRFVIAKVDVDNLNVYFELGLAMGLNKDVLLISEEDKVLQLPSDLRNWKCVTYPNGDYEKLKENIIRYYQENYHL
ncbi:MAG: hypothetical protein IJV50_03685 [Lachnospiraceae bacterium]|nr:hypothetical protein [Lachnospiraceae bacterium]